MRVVHPFLEVFTCSEVIASKIDNLTEGRHLLKVFRDADNKPIISVNCLNNKREIWKAIKNAYPNATATQIKTYFTRIPYVYDDEL